VDDEPKAVEGATVHEKPKGRRDAQAGHAPSRKFIRTTKEIAGLVRDVGLIIGVPALVTVGVSLYELQDAALKEQINANKAQADALTAQNAFLKETQYDRAAALLKGQKEVYEADRQNIEKQLDDAKKASDLKVGALEQNLRDAATSNQAARDGLAKQIADIKSADTQRIADLESQLNQRNKDIRSSDAAITTLGTAATAGDGKNATVTVGLSPAEIASLVRSATDAANSVDTRHIADLSKLLALNEDVTRTFLRSLGQADVPPDQLPARLAEIANRYRELQQQLTDIKSNQSPSDDLVKRAREELTLGKFEEASALLEQAQQADAQSLSRLADNFEQLGDIALTQKDAAKAAIYFGRAASVIASVNPDASARLRHRQAEAAQASH
jgi:hypothetical protein